MHSASAEAVAGPQRLRALAVHVLPVLGLLLVLSGCATRAPERDGPGSSPPSNLHQVPDAQPRVEALRVGGPNKPYAIAGRSYVPMTSDAPLRQTGLASWYGRKFHGRSTAMGETYDMYAMTAAHPTMPLPSYAVVRNPANGRQVVVRVNDRGPFVRGRIIDLSYTAALRLDLLRGVAPVEVVRLTHSDIRSGRWSSALGDGGGPPGLPTQAAAADADDAVALLDEASAGYWLQLGAFRQADGARSLQQQLQQQLQAQAPGLAPGLAVVAEDGLVRVQAGPWPTREDAQQAAAQLRQRLGLDAVLVLRR